MKCSSYRTKARRGGVIDMSSSPVRSSSSLVRKVVSLYPQLHSYCQFQNNPRQEGRANIKSIRSGFRVQFFLAPVSFCVLVFQVFQLLMEFLSWWVQSNQYVETTKRRRENLEQQRQNQSKELDNRSFELVSQLLVKYDKYQLISQLFISILPALV